VQKKPCPPLLGAARSDSGAPRAGESRELGGSDLPLLSTVEKPHLCKKSAEEDDEGRSLVTLAAGCRGAALIARRVRGATAMTPLIRQKLQTSGY